MNKTIFGLTTNERAFLAHLPPHARQRLFRYRSTLAPASKKESPATIFFHTAPTAISSRPPRIFARGALEKHLTPLPELLTETEETTQPRPIPRNRNLLKALCRGKGTLKQDSRGHLYLQIDNRFILALLPFLKSQGLVRPPYFNLFGSPGGAHITVISEREAIFRDLKTLGDPGKEYAFELEGLYSVRPATWPEVEQVWFFKVTSPDLETLRKNYFLPARPGGHSFLIAVAVKPQAKPSQAVPMMRISPCATAA